MPNSEKSNTPQSRPKPRRGGLGRGLESLIPTAPVERSSDENEGSSLQKVAINNIVANPYQPRLHMDQEQLEELSSSIRTHGLMQPLVVSESDSQGQYTLIAGERRWRASRLAGLKEVPVVVMTATPQEMLELAIIENVVRADLSPLEEAHAYRRLIEDFTLTQGEVAERVGKSRVAITNTLRLLNAPDQVQQAIVDGEITEGHARAMLGLPSIAQQIEMLDYVRNKNLNVRQTEQQVRNWLQAPKKQDKPRGALSSDMMRIESRLRESLGTRVTLRAGKQAGGKIEIEYASDEELQAIYDRLVEEDLW